MELVTNQILIKKRIYIICSLLFYLTLAASSHEIPSLTGINQIFEGLLFWSVLLVLIYPFIKFFTLSLRPRIESKFILLTFSISLAFFFFMFIGAIGVFATTKVSLILVCLVSFAFLFLNQRGDLSLSFYFTEWKKIELFALALCFLLFFYYSFKAIFISPYNLAVSGADPASTAQIAIYQFTGFPRITNTMPVVMKDPDTLSLSTVHIIQSGWSSVILGMMSMVTKISINRCLYWIWVVCPFFLFMNLLAFIWSIGQRVFKESDFLFWLPALILLFHNHQFHFLYVNGEFQEIYSFGLLFCSLSLIYFKSYSLAGFAMAAALSFQPDLSFPWALGISCWMLYEKENREGILKFGMASLIVLFPFLIQQLIVTGQTGLKSSDFVRGYQYIGSFKELLHQFSYNVIPYVLLLGILVLFKNPWKKLGLFFFLIFSFFAFYPWILVWINPDLAHWQNFKDFPMEFAGTFQDVIFPFLGKFYFYRVGVSWFIVGFSSLGLMVLYLTLKTHNQKKWVGVIFGFLLLVLLIIQHDRRKIAAMLYPLAEQQTISAMNYFQKNFRIEGAILAPSIREDNLAGKQNYDFWWTGSYFNAQASEGRALRSNSDMFVNLAKAPWENQFSDYFWKILGQFERKEVSRSSVEKVARQATTFYQYMIVKKHQCPTLEGLSTWKFLAEKNNFCLFERRNNSG